MNSTPTKATMALAIVTALYNLPMDHTLGHVTRRHYRALLRKPKAHLVHLYAKAQAVLNERRD